MIYDITRKRTTTERFRVTAATEEEACRTLALFDEGWTDLSEFIEKIETTTSSSETTVHSVKETQ
jgi:hypothetical protein